MATLEIGARSKDGLLEITDTNWDSNGTVRVTVRELIGERELPSKRLQAMRRLARRALSHPDQTRSSRVIRQEFSGGCTHVTFAVSRLER